MVDLVNYLIDDSHYYSIGTIGFGLNSLMHVDSIHWMKKIYLALILCSNGGDIRVESHMPVTLGLHHHKVPRFLYPIFESCFLRS